MLIRDVAGLGRLIRARRKEVGLTIVEAARIGGVSRRLLIELERGRRPNVGAAAVFRILELLGLRVDIERRGLPGA
jgi:transcriptional regulator with XRE-family HTH domain